MSDLMREMCGLRVEEMMQIINLVTAEGEFERASKNWPDRSWKHTLYGVPLMVRYFHEYFEGYKVQYCLSGRMWRVGFFASMSEPRGHFAGEPTARVYIQHLKNGNSEGGPGPHATDNRNIFYVRRWGDEDRYKHDMTLLRMFLPDAEPCVA